MNFKWDREINKYKEINEIFSEICKILKIDIKEEEKPLIKEQLGFLYERGVEDGCTNLVKKFVFFLEDL